MLKKIPWDENLVYEVKINLIKRKLDLLIHSSVKGREQTSELCAFLAYKIKTIEIRYQPSLIQTRHGIKLWDVYSIVMASEDNTVLQNMLGRFD